MQIKQTLASIAAVLLLSPFAHAADTYKIDPAHTSIGFSVRHLGLSNVRGQFKEFAGVIMLDLRTADFFDATNYPTITFKTKHVEMTGGQIILVADFTMRGVTKELRLPANLAGPAKDPWGNLRVGLGAKTKLNRMDYGIKYHQALETGVLAVGEEVELEINAEAIQETASKNSSETK